MKMEIESPVFDRLNLTTDQVMADVALGLYADYKVTLGQAAEIAGMSQSDFQRFAGDRGVAMHYDLNDLQHDLMVLRERGVS